MDEDEDEESYSHGAVAAPQRTARPSVASPKEAPHRRSERQRSKPIRFIEEEEEEEEDDEEEVYGSDESYHQLAVTIPRRTGRAKQSLVHTRLEGSSAVQDAVPPPPRRSTRSETKRAIVQVGPSLFIVLTYCRS
jgi:hypothetical protein